MSVNGEQRVLLKGGKGGYGNVHFKNSIRKVESLQQEMFKMADTSKQLLRQEVEQLQGLM